MSEFNDNSGTFEFDPIKENKPRESRGGGDPYSSARTPSSYPGEQKKSSGYGLVYTALILAILLVISIVVTVIILGKDKEEPPTPQQGEVIVEEEPEENKEEEEEEPEEKIIDCRIAFYPDTIIMRGETPSIEVDLYDTDKLQVYDTRRIKINDETEITGAGGVKATKEDLITYIGNMEEGKTFVFLAEIRTEDNVLLSVVVDYDFGELAPEEETPKEPEEGVIIPEETPAVEGI